MADNSKHNDSPLSNYSLSLISVGILVVFLAMVAFLYFKVNKKDKGNVVFPAGLNYTGNEDAAPTAVPPQRPNYDFAQMSTTTQFSTFKSAKNQYTFQYAAGLIPLIFPGDANDSVTFDVADVPVQFNLMVLVESISNYDPKLVGKPEQFVRNYWTYFGGLKAIKAIESYESTTGLKGYKVNYVTKAGVTTKDSYFFPIPGDGNRVIHITNVFPPEADAVFTKILETVDYIK